MINSEYWKVELKKFEKSRKKFPHRNPISELALEIAEAIENNTLDVKGIESIYENISISMLTQRAEKWGNDLKTDDNDVTDTVRNKIQLICKLIIKNIPKEKQYSTFVKFWQKARFGIVFTAHPTFALPKNESDFLASTIATVITGKKISSLNKIDIKSSLSNANTNTGITLEEEHKRFLYVSRNYRSTFKVICNEILKFSKINFDVNWLDFLPVPFTGASWVGYDLDGRTDIKWQDALAFRMQEKSIILNELLNELFIIEKTFKSVSTIHKEWQKKIPQQCKMLDEICDLLKTHNTNSTKFSEKINILTESNVWKNPEVVVTKLTEMAKNSNSASQASAYQVLACLINTFGFGVSEIHLRLNAVQLHNAIRDVVKINFDSLEKRSDIKILCRKIEELEKEDVNFSSLMQEHATARRQIILASQILKHIDCQSPIRLLIAECETPLTLLSALYIAKLFGVEGKLDISPLFETPHALEQGSLILSKVLKNHIWRDYISARGRMCYQTGFSDAGRFIGQVTATLAIERLHVKISDVANKYLSKNSEVIVFNTHGESMGRGGFPFSIDSRQKYIFSSMARKSYKDKGFSLRHEFSVQGGDGYILFQESINAISVINKLFATEYDCLLNFDLDNKNNIDEQINKPDLLYSSTDQSLDLFLGLKDWHQKLFHSSEYNISLSAYGGSFLADTGSRKMQRSLSIGNERKNPSQIRAIPHNSILQQLGYLANVCGGIGSAVSDIEVFVNILKHSSRLQLVLELALRAKALSSLDTVRAYANPLDSHFWTVRAYRDRSNNLSAYRLIASYLNDDVRAGAIRKVNTLWREDDLQLNLILERIPGPIGLYLRSISVNNNRSDIDILNAIRIALIIQVMVLAAKVPVFSDREKASHDMLMQSALRLDIQSVCSIIRIAFPISGDAKIVNSLAEKSSYKPFKSADYKRIEVEITKPIEDYGNMIVRIGVIASNIYGAYG